MQTEGLLHHWKKAIIKYSLGWSSSPVWSSTNLVQLPRLMFFLHLTVLMYNLLHKALLDMIDYYNVIKKLRKLWSIHDFNVVLHNELLFCYQVVIYEILAFSSLALKVVKLAVPSHPFICNPLATKQDWTAWNIFRLRWKTLKQLFPHLNDRTWYRRLHQLWY